MTKICLLMGLRSAMGLLHYIFVSWNCGSIFHFATILDYCAFGCADMQQTGNASIRQPASDLDVHVLSMPARTRVSNQGHPTP